MGIFVLAVLVASLLPLFPITTASAQGAPAASTGQQTVWLCRPGQSPDPCATNRAATSVSADGSTQALPASASARAAQKFDCFYVYPTVSTEETTNADLRVQQAEIATAIDQASQFSAACRVWAPMYRQVTVHGLATGAIINPSALNTAYQSLLSAWKDYLAHDNDGRPIVFIGHSQGSSMLIRLLQSQVDPSPKLRRQMVSAIIAGGNVQVPVGKDVGGSFQHIPLCRSAAQTGCVIAYSSFGSPPPSNSLFGKAGQGVSYLSGQKSGAGQSVACVNPVTFSGASGPLSSYFLAPGQQLRGITVRTPWVTYPGLYTATCEQSSGSSGTTYTWLQVDTHASSGDPRPTVTASLGPAWGYHLVDINLPLGNLVHDVVREESAYR